MDTKSNQGPGGPLKKTGGPGEEWDEVIGSLIDSIPASQLPGVRRVPQSYSAMRIADASTFTKQMSIEIESRCHKACVPMKECKCIMSMVSNVIKSWKKCHNPCKIRNEALSLSWVPVWT